MVLSQGQEMPLLHFLLFILIYISNNTYLVKISIFFQFFSSYSYNFSGSYGFNFLTGNASEAVDNTIHKLSIFT